VTDEIELAPEPGILVESLRDIGYSFNSALADIIDNSITACASQISVFALPVADSFKVAIIDDGNGLKRSDLLQAMRLGSTDHLGFGYRRKGKFVVGSGKDRFRPYICDRGAAFHWDDGSLGEG